MGKVPGFTRPERVASLPLSNTLAYFNEEEKSFMLVTPGVNVIKLFFFVNDDKVQ